jgi:hypothetical protein
MIHARLTNVLADGDGHMQAWDWKGAAALKCCVKHDNVLKKVLRINDRHELFHGGPAAIRLASGTAANVHVDACRLCELMRQGSDLAHRKPGFVEVSCANVQAFRATRHFVRTAKLLCAGKERVGRGEMTKTSLNELETAAGFRANRNGVAMSDKLNLDLPDVINYDWVHCALQGGVLICEVEALMAATDTPRSEVQAFLADVAWEYPGAKRTQARLLHRVFDARRVSAEDAEKIKASCSELLGLYGMLRCFFNTRFTGVEAFAGHLESFSWLCRTLDLLLSLKYGLADIDATSVGELQHAMQQHLVRHVALYGQRHVRPKHHWLLDCPQQFLRDSCVLDMFVIERGHLQVKSLAEDVRNTRVYERSVLSGVLCETLQKESHGCGDGLVGRTAVLLGMSVTVADQANVNCQQFGVGDVVLRNDAAAGLLRACALDAGDLLFLVEPLRHLREEVPGCSSYVLVGGLAVWDAREVRLAFAWRGDNGPTVPSSLCTRQKGAVWRFAQIASDFRRHGRGSVQTQLEPRPRSLHDGWLCREPRL